MWPFSSRSNRAEQIAPKPTEVTNWADFETNTASLKLWLPQLLVERVNWVSKETGASRPDVIRAVMFEHLYGKVAMLMLEAHKAEKDRQKRLNEEALARHQHDRLDMMLASDIRRSPVRGYKVDVAMFGKSETDLVIMIPSRMKQDIANQAKRFRLTPATYVRKALVLELLGEQVHTRWQEAVGNISADVLKLEQE